MIRVKNIKKETNLMRSKKSSIPIFLLILLLDCSIAFRRLLFTMIINIHIIFSFCISQRKRLQTSKKVKMNMKLKISIDFLEQCFFRLFLVNHSLLVKEQCSIVRYEDTEISKTMDRKRYSGRREILFH